MTEQTASKRLDPRMRTAIAGVASFGAMFAIGGAVAFGPRTGLSVAAGGLVAVLNLYGLAKILSALTTGRAEGDESSGMWGMFAVVKVVGLFGGVWLLMSTHAVDPMPLVVGWGALPVGIAIASLMGDRGLAAKRTGGALVGGITDKSAHSAELHAKEAPPLSPGQVPPPDGSPPVGSPQGRGEE